MVNLREVWNIELEILEYFHKVCMENGLKYSLTYGSLIGAVRHGGFIPWDDDVDVMMLRDDYEKLIKILEKQKSSKYIIQDYRSIPDYPNNFLKIRKNHTCYVQSEKERTKSYHKGIFIDVFPIDRKPNGIIEQLIQKSAVMVNLLFSRGYPSDGGITFVFIQKCLLSLGKGTRETILRISQRLMTRWNSDTSLVLTLPCTIETYEKNQSSDCMDDLMLMNFEGQQVFVTKRYDSFLKTEYGNYMQWPAKADRILTHQPICVSLTKNYEEL